MRLWLFSEFWLPRPTSRTSLRGLLSQRWYLCAICLRDGWCSSSFGPGPPLSPSGLHLGGLTSRHWGNWGLLWALRRAGPGCHAYCSCWKLVRSHRRRKLAVFHRWTLTPSGSGTVWSWRCLCSVWGCRRSNWLWLYSCGKAHCAGDGAKRSNLWRSSV